MAPSQPPLKVFQYDNCSTSRKALKFLDAHPIAYERVPIVERPPSKRELERMLELVGGNLRRMFNTSGALYRELKIGERLPGMSRDEALELLATHGKLVKRPFVLGRDFGL